MTTEHIVEINVGGRLFQTTVFTLTKYPRSMLSAMFSYTGTGMLLMPKTKNGHYFLDADPKYFEVILNWLRLGEITTNDPDIKKGTLSLANYFGLEELMEQLKSLHNGTKQFKRQSYPEILHVCIGLYALQQSLEAGTNASYPGVSILTKKKLTRVRQSLIAKYFDGEDVYVPIAYDAKSGFFVFNEFAVCSINPQINNKALVVNALEFLESDSSFNFYGSNIVIKTKLLLQTLGIHEESHYKVKRVLEERREHIYCFIWNEEFLMKYAN